MLQTSRPAFEDRMRGSPKLKLRESIARGPHFRRRAADGEISCPQTMRFIYRRIFRAGTNPNVLNVLVNFKCVFASVTLGLSFFREDVCQFWNFGGRCRGAINTINDRTSSGNTQQTRSCEMTPKRRHPNSAEPEQRRKAKVRFPRKPKSKQCTNHKSGHPTYQLGHLCGLPPRSQANTLMSWRTSNTLAEQRDELQRCHPNASAQHRRIHCAERCPKFALSTPRRVSPSWRARLWPVREKHF